MGVLEDIEYSKYIATEAMIENLAWQHVHAIEFGKRSKSTIMQILLATAQQDGGTLEALKEVYARIYPWVRRGVEKAGFTGKELDSKCKFAHSAMSTLKTFAERGGDLNDIDPATVTKRDLQPPSTPTKVQNQQQSLIESLKVLARSDEKAALKQISKCMARLRALRSEIKGPVRVVSHQLERQQPMAH